MCVCVRVCVCACVSVSVCLSVCLCVSIHIRIQVVNSGPFIHFPQSQDFINIQKKTLIYIHVYKHVYLCTYIDVYICWNWCIHGRCRLRCMHVRKNTLSCTWPEKDFFLYIYEVITWERSQRKLCQPLLRRCWCMRVHIYVYVGSRAQGLGWEMQM